MKCEEVATQGFIRRVYGDVGQCRRAEKPESGDEPPRDVRVSDVKVDGDRATASVLYVGGETDGAKGAFELRKEEDEWRIDDLGVDLLRSQVEKGLESGDQDTALLRSAKVRACARKAFTDLSDEQLKRVAYASISERESDQRQVAAVLTPCLSVDGSGTGAQRTSFLREKFEQGVTRSLRRDGVPQADIDCITRRLRSSISEAEIRQSATSGGRTTPEMTRKAAAAISACRGR